MKQKLFSMIALVAMLLMPQVMKADLVPVWSLNTTGAFDDNGGTANPFTKDGVSYEKGSISNTDDGDNDPQRWRFASVNAYIGCPLDAALKAGDVISIVAQASSTSSSLYMILRAENSSTAADTDIKITCGNTTEKTYSYTVTESDILNGKDKFYLMIATNGSYKIRVRSITVSTDATAYNINIGAMTNGTVTADKATAAAGQKVKLTVTPNAGYKLGTLTVKQGDTDVTVTNNEFTMPAGDVTINATFVEFAGYTVTVAATTNGTITPDKTEAEAGETVTLTVAPAENYELNTLYIESLTDDDSDNPSLNMPTDITFDEVIWTKVDDTHYTFTMPEADVLITATFKEIPAPPATTLTVAKEWVAFCSPKTYAVPEGLKAYTISAVTKPESSEQKGEVTLKEQTIIAEGVPMILENTDLANTTEFTLTEAEGSIPAADVCAEYKGSATAATPMSATNTNYVLKNGKFMRSTATQAAKYSCFLEFTTATPARYFVLTFAGATTGISNVNVNDNQNVNAPIFNLAGQRVGKNYKGVVIINGKKVVQK